MKANRVVLLAVAGVTALSLSGCAHGADVAATVDGTDISVSDVDFLTRLQCDSIADAVKNPEQAQQQAQAVSLKLVRASVVNALVQSELNAGIGEQEDASYDKASYRQAMDSFESDLKAAPAKDRARFKEMVAGFYRNQLKVYTVAAQKLAAEGIAQPEPQQLDSTAQQLVAEFRDKADIDIDPVYGADDTGVAGAVNSSLSTPLSSFAKGTTANPEDPAFVSKLPATQKCG